VERWAKTWNLPAVPARKHYQRYRTRYTMVLYMFVRYLNLRLRIGPFLVSIPKCLTTMLHDKLIFTSATAVVLWMALPPWGSLHGYVVSYVTWQC
jgi:hypothetical protein